MSARVRTAAGAAALAVAPILAGGALAARQSARAPVRALDVVPFPGTPDAAPGSEIMFPALSPAALASVTVEGSRTGPHAGRLRAQPAGQGTAFSPREPFAPGERVWVMARLRSAVAGAPGSRRLRFSFTVARAASVGSGASPARSRAGSGSMPTTHTFVTEPGFHPPIVTMSGKVAGGAGDIFLDAGNSGQNAPYILGPHGSLLWYQPTAGKGSGPAAFNLRLQTYNGRPVLTYWRGKVVIPPGTGDGVGVMLNERYQTIHTVTAGAGYQKRGIDQHEFTLGHEGKQATAFVTIAAPVHADLRAVNGPSNGTALDWIIQEIDVATNRVVWEWHALGHVPIADSYLHYVPGQAFDFFHLNSIQQLSNGNLIISARHTFAVYSIDKRTGNVNWELGGKHSSFSMRAGTRFEWQHHATLHNNGLVTVFDDGSGLPGPTEKQSRALEIHIGLSAHRATLVHAYAHQPNSVLAGSEGSTELLSGGDVFVGWGDTPYFSENAPSGTQVLGGAFVRPVETYRAYMFGGWVGSPLQRPALAVRSSPTAGHDDVYASWNGATQVAKWKVLAGPSSTSLHAVAQVPWASFETRVGLPASDGPYFEVQALDAKGSVLPGGTSAVMRGP